MQKSQKHILKHLAAKPKLSHKEYYQKYGTINNEKYRPMLDNAQKHADDANDNKQRMLKAHNVISHPEKIEKRAVVVD